MLATVVSHGERIVQAGCFGVSVNAGVFLGDGIGYGMHRLPTVLSVLAAEGQ